MFAAVPLRTVWIPRGAVDAMINEAYGASPNETGGVLVGYWSSDGDHVVVTAVIGPGPTAVHRRASSTPDAAYQEAEIARRYESSERRYTYIGDWHSHPDGRPLLSRQDRRTLAAIAGTPEARAPVPLMGILRGGPPWELAIWRGGPVRAGPLCLGVRVEPLCIRVF